MKNETGTKEEAGDESSAERGADERKAETYTHTRAFVAGRPNFHPI